MHNESHNFKGQSQAELNHFFHPSIACSNTTTRVQPKSRKRTHFEVGLYFGEWFHDKQRRVGSLPCGWVQP